MGDKLRVGIIGVGNISPAYISGCAEFDVLELVACADLNVERAQQVAKENNIPRALTVEEMLGAPDIDIVINLTIPRVHAEISLAILQSGKHVYSEKPLATNLSDARKVIQTADAYNLRVGCAPDTFMFAPHQTARKLIDDGAIGKPVAAVGFMASHGPESWHPNPKFFYEHGGGPMFDMGPYYVTCLVNLLGPAVRVSGAARASFPERVAHTGEHLPVEVPTHYSGTIEFESGTVATLITSFDVWAHHLPQMEIYGENSSMTIPDPNGHDPRTVQLFNRENKEWEAQPLQYEDHWKRGIGVADMAYGILSGRPHRASGALALHVLEIMSAFETATQTGSAVALQSRAPQPQPLPTGLAARVLDR